MTQRKQESGEANPPDTIQSVYTYDHVNRLDLMQINRIGQQQLTTPLASFDYTLGRTPERLGLAETINSFPAMSRSVGYTYDPLDRLTTENVSAGIPSGSITYDSTPGYNDPSGTGYDRVGNRRSRTVSTPELQDAGVSQYSGKQFTANDQIVGETYDDNGNTLRGDVTPAQTADDQYDYENRLIRRVAGTKTIEITYDGDGNRVRKIITDSSTTPPTITTTTYLVDTLNPSGYAQVLQEQTTVGNGTSVNWILYAYGHDLISQIVVTPANSSGTLQFYGYDGHGSVRFLTHGDGNITDTYTYDAFGILIARTGDSFNSYLYAGEQFDPDLGLGVNRARYLNPNTGRFWTMDSFEGRQREPRGLHKYLYAQANPINGLDPSGFAIELDSAKGILVHEKFYPYALTMLGVTKWADTAIGVAIPSLAGQPGSALRPDIIADKSPVKAWYELKPISHKNSKLTAETQNTLLSYGTLLAQAGVQPGLPQVLVPQNFRLGTIVDPLDLQRLDVWLEAGDMPGLIYYYFKNPDEERERVPVYLPIPIVVPEYNAASRAVAATGGRAAIATRAIGTAAAAGIALAVAIATLTAMAGVP